MQGQTSPLISINARVAFTNDSQTDSRLARRLSISANENYNMWASSWPVPDTAILMAEGSQRINMSPTHKANHGKKQLFVWLSWLRK